MTAPFSPGALAQMACLLEVTARKPGNVHRGRDFADTHYLDFLLSAAAIAGPLDSTRTVGIGAAVLAAVAATRQVVVSNTNLGMILVLAPMTAVPDSLDLEAGLGAVLDATTIDDARLIYRAIRQAEPGGLGQVAAQDVADEPTVTLRAAMALAAGHDGIARQYAEGFADVFGIALPALRAALDAGKPLESAIVRCFLALLAARPDTLIARKRGTEAACEASRRAAEVLAVGATDAAHPRYRSFDDWLRADGHARNPGTTADLVAAALFAALRAGTIALPLPSWSGAIGTD